MRSASNRGGIRVAGAAVLLMAVVGASCATRPHSLIVTPQFEKFREHADALGSKQVRRCAQFLFGLPIAGDGSLQEAMAEVLEEPKGDILYVTVDVEHAWYVFVTEECTIVRAVFAYGAANRGGGEASAPPRAPSAQPAVVERLGTTSSTDDLPSTHCANVCKHLLQVLFEAGEEVTTEADRCMDECPTWRLKQKACIVAGKDPATVRGCAPTL